MVKREQHASVDASEDASAGGGAAHEDEPVRGYQPSPDERIAVDLGQRDHGDEADEGDDQDPARHDPHRCNRASVSDGLLETCASYGVARLMRSSTRPKSRKEKG